MQIHVLIYEIFSTKKNTKKNYNTKLYSLSLELMYGRRNIDFDQNDMNINRMVFAAHPYDMEYSKKSVRRRHIYLNEENQQDSLSLSRIRSRPNVILSYSHIC